MPASVITRSPATPITLANWQLPEHTGWSYRHIRELIPTARIRCASSPSPLPIDGRDHRDLPVRRLLDDDRTDGVLALHR